MRLKRYAGNPILSPLVGSDWEGLVTCNPGAWYEPEEDCVYLLYRAAGEDPAHRIHLGLATSRDGINFERASDRPVLSPSEDNWDAGCVEDPRIVKMDGWYVVTYASRPFPPGQYWKPENKGPWRPSDPSPHFPWLLRENATSTGLAFTRDFRHWIRAGRMTNPTVDDRDVILFPEKIGGKYAMLHRPMNWVGPEYGTEYPAIWIAFSDDLLHWTDSRLLVKAELPWENNKIGGNTPPIKTEWGWLTLYHAVGADGHYRLGALVLDLDDPCRVLGRTVSWILQPEEWYEIEGFYRGCVFPCGAVVIGDILYVYYGGADRYVGLATCNVRELVEYAITCV